MLLLPIFGSFNAVSPDMKLRQSTRKCPRRYWPDKEIKGMYMTGSLHIKLFFFFFFFLQPEAVANGCVDTS